MADEDKKGGGLTPKSVLDKLGGRLIDILIGALATIIFLYFFGPLKERVDRWLEERNSQVTKEYVLKGLTREFETLRTLHSVKISLIDGSEYAYSDEQGEFELPIEVDADLEFVYVKVTDGEDYESDTYQVFINSQQSEQEFLDFQLKRVDNSYTLQ